MRKQQVIVVDYGMGNLRSVEKALAHVADANTTVRISSRIDDVLAADRVVFPGQGAMPDCMQYLRESGLQDAVLHAAATKPFFGVCVGMQMLFDISEEGHTPGLGLFSGAVKRFRPTNPANKVPHMGWNQVVPTTPAHMHAHPIWQSVAAGERFYFVHSFYCAPTDPKVTNAVAEYELPFCASISRGNVFATQFHPEKSQQAGLQLYKNFLHWQPA
jgi:imidazole glycerol-phosphate synthase subunit HisH